MKLSVKVSAGSKENRILEFTGNGELWVRVSDPPEHGKANKALIGLLSDNLKIQKSSLRIVMGGRHKEKVIAIEGISYDELVGKIINVFSWNNNKETFFSVHIGSVVQ